MREGKATVVYTGFSSFCFPVGCLIKIMKNGFKGVGCKNFV